MLQYFGGSRVGANPTLPLCLDDPLFGLASPQFHLRNAFHAEFGAGGITSGPDRQARKPLLAASVAQRQGTMDNLVKDPGAPAFLDDLVDLRAETFICLPIAGFGIDIAECLRVLANMLDEFGLGLDPKLPEDTLEMVAYGGRADRELVCDRGYAPAVSKLVEDFLLASTERIS